MNYFFCLFSLGMTIAGIFLTIYEDFFTGATVTTFFAVTTGVFITTIRDQRKFKKQVTGKEGVTLMDKDQKYFMPRAKICAWLFVGFLISTLMSFGAYLGGELPPIFIVCTGLIAFITGLLFFLIATRLMGKSYICLREGGLEIGEGNFCYFIHWENIALVQVGEHHDNQCVFGLISDLNMLLNTVQRLEATTHQWEKDKFCQKLEKKLQSNYKWTGNHFLYLSTSFGLDVMRIYCTILSYTESGKTEEE